MESRGFVRYSQVHEFSFPFPIIEEVLYIFLQIMLIDVPINIKIARVEVIGSAVNDFFEHLKVWRKLHQIG